MKAKARPILDKQLSDYFRIEIMMTKNLYCFIFLMGKCDIYFTYLYNCKNLRTWRGKWFLCVSMSQKINESVSLTWQGQFSASIINLRFSERKLQVS